VCGLGRAQVLAAAVQPLTPYPGRRRGVGALEQPVQMPLGDAAVARDTACVEFRIVEMAVDVGHHPLQHDLPAAPRAGLGLRAQRGGQQFHAGMQHVARVAARQLAEARVERDEVIDEQTAQAAGGFDPAADEIIGSRQRELQFALRHREGDLPQARTGDEGHRACAVPEREAARVQREVLAIDRQTDRPLGDVDQVVERLAVLRHLARTARADDAALGGGEVRDAKAVEAALADEGREALAVDRSDRPVQVGVDDEIAPAVELLARGHTLRRPDGGVLPAIDQR